MSNNAKQTIIEEGTEFTGSIKSECGITLSGRMNGEVKAPSLTVNPSGSVRGQVKVNHLHSEGELSGEIEAEVVELSGRISDQTVINATSLEVKLNQSSGVQVTFGNCELKVGQKTGNKNQGKDQGKEHTKDHKPAHIHDGKTQTTV